MSKNFRAGSTGATNRKQAMVREVLRLVGDGLTVSEIGKALGCSRQLALYHVKKMAAAGLVVMMLVPCAANSGVQFKVWDEMALAAHFARKLAQTPAFELLRAA